MSIYQELLRQGNEATDSFVRVVRRDRSAVVTLDEPARLNVLSAPLVIQTKAALVELVTDPEIRTVVLTGAGRGFSAGGDLEMMRLAEERLGDAEGSTDIWRWIRYEFGGVARLIARSDTAFVAAMNGPAAGVGLAWALTCDVVIASEDALIVPAFGRLGLIPEVGTSWALTRRLGYQGAFAFFAGGLPLDAHRARELGLVQEVVAPDDLMAAADRWCDRIAALPPHALAMAKPLLRQAADATWDSTITMEEFAEPNCFTTGAFQQAVRTMVAASPGSTSASS
ncbi:enoyl-CoA hydratase/isomerase family protein [Mycolicibacterium hippocampi]|uniref:enoyl-CoA hydratase/isomerase family protein n=1 Tax=Mycolicibacterium hippocampi TaxID=659824 RepID=UPI003511D10F